MKICSMCRSQLPDSYVACPNCGNPNLVMDQSANQVNNNYQQPFNGYQQQMNYGQPMPGQVQNVEDKGNLLYGIPGLIIPLVGWIMYFVMKNTKPKSAKIAGISGFIGWVFWFIVNMSNQ